MLRVAFTHCRSNTHVQVGRLRRPQVFVCFACAGAHAKHTQTCRKGLFAAQPQHVREYCPHCLIWLATSGFLSASGEEHEQRDAPAVSSVVTLFILYACDPGTYKGTIL